VRGKTVGFRSANGVFRVAKDDYERRKFEMSCKI
jgi:hypothetical protein